jgi:predicted DNA-binding protein
MYLPEINHMSKQLTLRIPVHLHETIKNQSKTAFTTTHAMIIKTLAEYFSGDIQPITIQGLGKNIDTRPLALRLPETLYHRVDTQSDIEDRSMNAIIVRILRSKFETKENSSSE